MFDELTEHGHPVARIVPLQHRSRYEQLVAEGRIVPPRVDSPIYSIASAVRPSLVTHGSRRYSPTCVRTSDRLVYLDSSAFVKLPA